MWTLVTFFFLVSDALPSYRQPQILPQHEEPGLHWSAPSKSRPNSPIASLQLKTGLSSHKCLRILVFHSGLPENHLEHIVKAALVFLLTHRLWQRAQVMLVLKTHSEILTVIPGWEAMMCFQALMCIGMILCSTSSWRNGDSAGLEWSLRIGIFHKFFVSADAAPEDPRLVAQTREYRHNTPEPPTPTILSQHNSWWVPRKDHHHHPEGSYAFIALWSLQKEG